MARESGGAAGDPGFTLMTPGPTELPADVRSALARPIHNPDVQAEFTAFYRSLLTKVAAVYDTDDEVVVLGGEGMLGLEASVSSLVDVGEPVLCLANGLFGAGFADLVETHGGQAVVVESPPDRGFDTDSVKEAIETHDPVAATMVHCETPTGLLNDLGDVLALLDDAGVLSIVDAVSSLGGTAVPVDRIDVCLGASQKCLSSPPGLSTLSVSNAAWVEIERTDQDSFYTSLAPWADIDLTGDEAVLLPYTPPISNLYALDASLDRLLDEGLEAVYERHDAAARRCRERGRDIGLEPFPAPGWSSPTVTAFEVDGSARDLRHRIEREHGIVLSTGLGDRADDLLRVGHMGYQATVDRVDRTMDAIADTIQAA